MGTWFKERGLSTIMLLGDTADAKGWSFLKVAMDDGATYEFIDAVSFHSWRGYSDENLLEWRNAADRMNVPLLVGEGSIDAGAWRYPDVFEEETYAMDEIELYIKMMDICQPEAILQWQLTADYSPMVGAGIFGDNNRPLTPT